MQYPHPDRFRRQYAKEAVTSTVLEFSVIPPTPKIASNLHITEEDYVYKIIRVRNRNGVPCVMGKRVLSPLI